MTRWALLGLALVLAACGGATRVGPADWRPLPDLSGLAWIEGDAFLAVHDAKAPDEAARPRVSLLELPPGGAPSWAPLAVRWPDMPSHDLESIARIPGTATYLLAESGNGGSAFRRLFVAQLDGRALTIREAAEWPVEVFDVEGTAVARLGERLYLLFAERAHGENSTLIAWAPLSLDPLRLGEVREVPFPNPMQPAAGARPVSALEVGPDGRVWAASAFDPDDDGGPFRSAVWEIGRFEAGADGEGELRLHDRPLRVAQLDGLKVEALAVQGAGPAARLVVGTDDEDFGGVIRPLPPAR